MLDFPCPQLSRLAKLLFEAYDARFEMINRNSSDTELLQLKQELFGINRLITLHRQRCAYCTPLSHLTIASPSHLKQLAREASASALAGLE